MCDVTAGGVCPPSPRTPTPLSVKDSVQTGSSVTSQCAANVRHTGSVNTLYHRTRNLAGHRTQQRIIIRSAELDRNNKNPPEKEEEEEERRKSNKQKKAAGFITMSGNSLDSMRTTHLFSNLTFEVDTREM